MDESQLKTLVRKSKKTAVDALMARVDESRMNNSSDELPVDLSETEREYHEVFETPEQREADLKRIREEMKNGTYQPPLF